MMDKKLLERISIDPRVLHGKPHIKGTRIAVSMVMELLASGYSPKDICSDRFYPDLTEEDIFACIVFAKQFLDEEEIHFAEELQHSP